MASKNNVYELALKIAGKMDGSLKNACNEANDNLASLGETAKKAGKIAATAMTAAATAAAGVAVTGVKAYTEHEKASNSLSSTTGATGDQLERLTGIMENVYKNNYGEDIQDVSDSVAKVNQNLKNLPTDKIQEATEAALTLRDTFGYDVEETTRAAAAIEKNFGTAAADAFSLMAAGAQNGLDYSGEMIDTINEYSVQFAKLGFSADGMFNLLQSGAESSAWNLDKVGDAVKEFSIRSIDGSKTTTEAFEALGYNAQTMMETFAAGGEGANSAFYDVLDTLMAMDDQVARDAVGVGLFGTMWEDLGTEAMQAMANASTAAYDAKGALEQIQEVNYNDLGTQWEGFKRQAESMLVLVGKQLVPYAKEGLEYLTTNVLPVVQDKLQEIIPKLAEGAKWLWEHKDLILAVGAGIASMVGTFKALKTAATVVQTFKSVSTVIGGVSKAGGTLGKVFGLLNVKFFLIAAVIGAVVAAGILIYKNWDTIKAKAVELGAKISEIWGNIKAWVSGAVSNLVSAFQTNFPLLSAYLTGWWESVSAAWENVKAIFTNIIDFVKNVFSGNWSAAWDNIVAIFGNIFGMIVNLAKAPINGVISAINWVLSKINSISVTIPDWVPGVGGKTLGFDIPTIPALAAGGIATAPTLAQIGEGGEPEAVLPLSKLAALLDEWTKPKPGGGGTGGGGETVVFSPVFNFYGGTPSREEAEEAGRVSFAEFKRLYKQMKAEEKRKQFSPA